MQVEIRHGGVSGSARRRRSSATTSRRRRRSPGSRRVALGDDPWALDEISARLPPGEQAARAAVDAALHDLQGKLTGLPVYRLLGLRASGPPTSWTVWLGDPDDMARRAEKSPPRGFQRLKLKLGGRDGLDVERVRAVRGATDLPLQVDVNEYWTLDEALELPAAARRSSTASSRCPPAIPAGRS